MDGISNVGKSFGNWKDPIIRNARVGVKVETDIGGLHLKPGSGFVEISRVGSRFAVTAYSTDGGRTYTKFDKPMIMGSEQVRMLLSDPSKW